MEHGILATSESEIQNIENWLDAQLDLVATTYAQNVMDGMSGITWSDSPKRDVLERLFGQTGRRLLISYEMAGTEGHGDGDYSGAASGSYDAEYRQFAQELIDRGMEDSIIRPNHEFNLSWNSKYPNDPSNYRDAFARCVREMQSISGADFTFLFSPARNRLGVAPDAWPPDSQYWPSSEPEPWVVTSNYDKGYEYSDDISDVTQEDREANWQNVTVENIGMWADFAEQRGSKYAGSPEWGLMGEGSPQPGGGDNPWFIEQYITYGEANGFEFQTYWNGAHHTIYPRDHSANLQDGSDKFKQMVGDRLRSSDSDSGTEDDSDSGSTDTSYGGYNQPEAGTSDWHVPLNENFSDIEADIQDIAARLEKLEGN